MSAVTTLLRLLVESDSTSHRAEICTKLLKFLEVLKVAREKYSWDLAQLCIDTCGQPIEKLVAVNSTILGTEREPNATAVANGFGTVTHDVAAHSDGTPLRNDVAADLLADPMTFPLDLDIPWDYLWDDMVEPWPMDLPQNVL